MKTLRKKLNYVRRFRAHKANLNKLLKIRISNRRKKIILTLLMILLKALYLLKLRILLEV